MQLSRRFRRATVVVHALFSVSWFGLTLGLLVLGIRAYTSRDPDVVAFSYRAADVFGEWMLIPVSLLTLLSGLVLALGTPWGLVRHKWVLTKFVLTVVTVCLVYFALTPSLRMAAQQAVAGNAVADVNLIVAPTVATGTYGFMLALSLLKPWRLTRWGRKARERASGGGTVRVPSGK